MRSCRSHSSVRPVEGLVSLGNVACSLGVPGLLVVEVLGGTLEGGQWETCSVSGVLSVEVVKVSRGR